MEYRGETITEMKLRESMTITSPAVPKAKDPLTRMGWRLAVSAPGVPDAVRSTGTVCSALASERSAGSAR